MKVAAFILSAVAIAAASPASAQVYNVTFNSTFGAFSGTFTTTPDPNPNYDLVTSLTGTLGVNTATLLAPNTFSDNDNLFSPTGPNFVSGDGIGFSAGGFNFDLYNGGGGALFLFSSAETNSAVTNFTVQQVAPGVPEPDTWAMMLLGFGAIGFVMRRTRGGLGIAKA